MAAWYTLSGTPANGLVTRTASTSSQADLPPANLADDPWFYAGLLPLPAPSVGDHFIDGEYENDDTSLSTAKGNKIAALRDACANHIKFLGFVCSCQFPGDTGTRFYVFPTEAKDQANIVNAGVVALAMEPTNANWRSELWCGLGADGTARVSTASDWAIRELSIANIKEVMTTLRAHVHDAQEELQIKTADALAATTVSAVNAVTWVPPNS